MLTLAESNELDVLNRKPARLMTKAEFERWVILTDKEQPELDASFDESPTIIDGVCLGAWLG